MPVIWVGAERSFQIKNDKDIRTTDGQLILPLITIERTSISKDPSFKGAVQANIIPFLKDPRGYRQLGLPIARRVMQEKTRNFANADQARKSGPIDNPNVSPKFQKINHKIVYETTYMPIPTYIKIMYTITLRTEYQQQMNTMLTPFITNTGQINSFIFQKNLHRYEAFIEQDFTQNNNIANLATEERAFGSKVQIKVLGYLNGATENYASPIHAKAETIAEIKLIRERTIVGDEKPWRTDNKKYRE